MTLLLIKEKLELNGGCHVWKVKVHKSCTISVGICVSGKLCGLWYSSTGCTVDNTASGAIQGQKLEDFSSMDFICVKLDLDAHKLYFGKNDDPPVLAFTNLPSATFNPSAKISGFSVTRKDVQFIHADGGSMDIISTVLDEADDAVDDTIVPAPKKAPEAKPKADTKAEPKVKEAPKANGALLKPKAEEPDIKQANKHDHDHHKHDKSASTDDARQKPAWVNAAGRLLHGTKPSTSWCKGHGPLFKTKKGSCSRCECLPCPECVHSFQNIRDTLLTMLAKYHCDMDSSILLNYSLMFTGLKKNGDVKVDVYHRCCSKHKQRFLSSITINTCCRKHKVETCERIVQTLKENARSSRPNDARHGTERGGDDLGHDMDDIETDEMYDQEEDEEDEDHDYFEDGESSAHTSDGSHKANGVADPDAEGVSRQASTTSAGRHRAKARSKPKGTGGRRNKKRGRR